MKGEKRRRRRRRRRKGLKKGRKEVRRRNNLQIWRLKGGRRGYKTVEKASVREARVRERQRMN